MSEPFEPDLKDAKWYVPITSIVKGIGVAWRWLFGNKPQSKEVVKMSAWVTFRDWFCLTILPIAVGVLSSVIKEQAVKIPGLLQLIGLIQPLLQKAYDAAVTEQDLKMQAILLAVLSKLFGVVLSIPGVVVLEEKEANDMLLTMSKSAMDNMPKEKKDKLETWTANWTAGQLFNPDIDGGG